MAFSYKSLLLFLASVGSARYIPNPEPLCKDIKLAVTATAENFNLPPYESTEHAALLKYLGSLPKDMNTTTVSGTFNIAGTYCEPPSKVPEREGTIQFLLHGLGYTRSYWNGVNYPDTTFPGSNSWVSHATSQGYTTLAIDNLGNGDSDLLDPVKMIQFPLQSEILLSIIHGLRNQSFPGIPKSFNKVIFVTHSYGSIHGRELATFHPNNGADAYILTASSSNLVGVSTLAKNLATGSAKVFDPSRFSDLPTPYIAIDPTGFKDIVYPLDGDFDPKLLAKDMSDPHVFAVGELASPKRNETSNFTGPVMILTGRIDPIVCDAAGNNSVSVADCGVGKTSNPGLTVERFPEAKPFGVYVPDRIGHNLNLGYSAPEVFGAANEFLELAGF